MRIVSLLPEATAILDVLGLAGQTISLPASATDELSATITAAQPTLIFTSETREGGGWPRRDVRRVVGRLRPRPAVYALEPHTVGDLLSDIKTVGDATGRQREARATIEALRARIDAVTLRSARALATHPPRRAALLVSREPPVAAGWWLAEMVGLAGGLDVLGGLGRSPRAVTQAEIEAAHPDLILSQEALAADATPSGWERAAWPDPVALLECLADLLLVETDRAVSMRPPR